MLQLHRAERSSTLATALADLLKVPLADPFTSEIIAVPAKGVERWLNQRLSTVLGATGVDGIAANIVFPTPSRLIDDAVAVASGTGADDDPWSSAHVLWAVLAVIDDSLTEPWSAVLAKHLGAGADGHRSGRRYATAAHLTELFRGYGAQRPDMLVDWAAGRDTDGAGGPLDADLSWQAELWRRLRERIGSPSPAERLEDACSRLRGEPGIVDLPERLSLFGPTRLASDQLAVIAALSANRDVHLWLPHSSPAMWSTLQQAEVPSRRATDSSALVVEHPLLSSLARDVRELQLRLAGMDTQDAYYSAGPTADTLLARVQSDIRTDTAPRPGTGRLDGSVEVHACHGPARQVEVLRECLLHLFQQDATLEPRDVLVMCPDVETYAPIVRATFGQGVLGHPGHRLRVRLADRALRQTNPLLATVASLLRLADARATASQVLDVAASSPVRTRFGFTDDDLERLREWTAESGARWGIVKRQREAFGLGEFRQNTFSTALDRILLGATADETESAWLDLALPLDDVDSNDIDLAGRFAEFIDRLAVTLRDLQGPQAATGWVRVLRRALDLLAEVDSEDVWQLAQAHRELAAATEHSGDAQLRLADVRAMLANRLAGRPTRANFRTGELTVCTMVPMRSVPHRVVVLLGLDDEVFPRAGTVDGDNVLARNPCLGERDTRSEDRQLLLDAVMSASERLLLFYTGADPVTGAVRPPAIPLSELLDVLTTMVGPASHTEVTRRHPLQPFDRSNFEGADPFSFDEGALAGARASDRAPIAEPMFLPHTLAPAQLDDVDLADLVAFLVHPTQAFLRQRLGLRVPELDEDIADALNVKLDPLAQWDLGDRMLAARLTGTDIADFAAAEWRRGTLPPFRLGRRQLDDVERAVDALAVASLPIHDGRAETMDVAVDLGAGRRLTGTITGIHGNVIAGTSYSRLGPKHRLAAWARLLAIAANGDSGPRQAVTTGRGVGRRPAWRSTLVAPADSLEQLTRLVDLRDRGMAALLPIATGASALYADRRFRGATTEDAMDSAAKEWSGAFGDSKDRHLTYVYGTAPSFADVTAEAPRDDESDWFADEPTRFGVLACRLWTPLLSAETLGQP